MKGREMVAEMTQIQLPNIFCYDISFLISKQTVFNKFNGKDRLLKREEDK